MLYATYLNIIINIVEIIYLRVPKPLYFRHIRPLVSLPWKQLLLEGCNLAYKKEN